LPKGMARLTGNQVRHAQEKTPVLVAGVDD
jgi:hypothetical protein